MRLFEIAGNKFLDFVEESPLFEMAWSRRDIERKITGLGAPILEHLIKILKWKDELNLKKHCSDIDNWLFQVQNFLLKNGKRPDANSYFTWLVKDQNISEVLISRWIKRLYKYEQLKEIDTDENVYLRIVDIMSRICSDLSINKFETIEDYLK